MKKFYFILAASAMILAACSGNKKAAQEETPAPAESFEAQQIKAGMNVRLDSLTNAFNRIKPFDFITKSEDGSIALTAEEKKVKPDYLMNPAELANQLDNLSMKYRACAIYQQDQVIAKAYEMEDVYAEPLAKLVVEVNDPAQKYVIEHAKDADVKEQAYKIAEESGRANYHWQAVASGIIESLYIINQNQEKFLASFTDKDAEDVTFQVVLLVEAYAELAEYDPELKNIYNVIMPLQVIDAITVDQLREQLNSLKDDIANARAALFL